MVEFAEFTSEEQDLVEKILNRVKKKISSTDRISLHMDLAAVHASNPLRLADLADADDFNFFRDMNGIGEHLNRETGKLEDYFIPRYSLRR